MTKSLHSKLFLVLSFVIALPALSQNVKEHTSKRESIEREIQLLDKQLASTISRTKTSTKELTLIQQKILGRKKLLTQIEGEIDQILTEIKSKERETQKLQEELNRLKENYKHLIYNAYKTRDKSMWSLYILASKNIEQGYRRWNYLRRYSDALKESAQSIKIKQEELGAEIQKLEKMGDEALQMKGRREREYHTLAQEEQRAKKLVNTLSRQERDFRTQIANKRKEVERLNREIQRILAEAAKEKGKENKEESAAARALSATFESNKGNLPWPVKEGVIIEKFGQHNHPVFKSITLPFNNGINIATSLNAQVYAVFDGVVKQILVMPGYNQCVLVKHGDYYTFYTKLERVSVTAGQLVKTGQLLGSLEESEGNSVIHFQLWEGMNKQNPEHWISK